MTARSEAVGIDPRRYRDVLAHYPTGVTVVTAMDGDGQPCGIAVGSFTSVSIDPPLVAFMPARTSTTFPRIREASSFCVNVLSTDQDEVCRLFATQGADRFAGLRWSPAPSGAPILDGASAWLDCTIDVIHEAGDHFIVLGRVQDLEFVHSGPPLVFFRGGYGRFEPTSLVLAPEHDITDQVRIAGLARRAMEELARDCNLEVLATGVVREHVVLLASADAPDPQYRQSRVGYRTRLAAPVWSPFIAWENGATVGRWLARLEPPAQRLAHESLARVRDRRWSVALGNDAYDHLESAMGDVTRRGAQPALERSIDSVMSTLVAEDFDCVIDADQSYDIRLLSAPVFDARGHVVLALGLRGFVPRVTGRQAQEVAESLVRVADRVSERIGANPAAHKERRDG